jgi:transcriptional regulator with XRE-family HTH domain
MYNGQIIKELLSKRKIQNKTLNEALGWNNSQLKQVVEGNPRVSTLELIADFFKVSMDVFFDRNIPVSGHSNLVHGDGNNVNSVIFGSDQMTDRIQSLELLLTEKDKRIEVLEELNRMLRRELDQK